jgi:integrase
MTVNIVLRTDKPKKDGSCPLHIRFIQNGKIAYYGTGISAFPNEFDKKNGLLLLDNRQTRERNRRNNIFLTSELDRAERLLHDLKMRGNGNVQPNKFKDLFLNEQKRQTQTFYSFYEEFIERKSGRTKDVYQCTCKKLKVMFPAELHFEDIDYKFLTQFEAKCHQRGNKINTISIDLRNIRAVFNEAMKMKIVSKDLYPFDDFKIKNEETEHRALSVEQLRQVFEFEGTAAENYARDVSKLIFLLIGINATDLYDLQASDNERINYRRDKTGRLYSIKVEPEMLPLFERFKGKNNFLCFKEQLKDCATLTKKINGTLGYKKGLCSIGESLGISHLTAYVMRHTWGTLAGELDIPKETIAQALGHATNSVTDIYIKFNRNKIDEANRKVIDYVFNN